MKVSVIIPCYNQGIFVDDAVSSVLAQTYKDIEIIVVNDGSTDLETNQILDKYKRPNTFVIKTVNQGLSEARNTGIKSAQGEVILPLDADDKIAPTYIEKAVNVLKSKKADVVYCEAEFFGAKKGRWAIPENKMPDNLLRNFLFCSALFRKKDWEKYGGFRKEMKYGYEDFDFWLSFIEDNKVFYQIPEILFFYRIKSAVDPKSDHSIVSINSERAQYSFNQLFHHHKKLYLKHADFILDELIKNLYIREHQRLDFEELREKYKNSNSTGKNSIFHFKNLRNSK